MSDNERQGQATRLVQKLLQTARDNGLCMASMTVDGVTATVAMNDSRWQVTVSGTGELDDAVFGMPENPRDPVHPAYYAAGRTLLGRLLEDRRDNPRASGLENGVLYDAGWQLNVGRDVVYTKLVLTNNSGMRVELQYDSLRPEGLERVVRALGYELEEGRIK